MSIDSHIENLQQKRTKLKVAIHEEMKSPHYDEQRVIEMKKANLRMKDEIVSLFQKLELAS
ncbi:MAG: DUF465 domain-containing protein [Alphaproteobacteria bacterium]|nr:MAG: DUF465 domain-containing protein [Alphaproteobacteria bacterium]TAE81080.1 MAG: DUF465 domain-containing protein [Alphaproteobacteria bacterium]TAF16080.1 MAG: DUF465 domain-containing protein [Alphaproteobacteria bacterium]TAF40179.1 MAG: DUF465 domain-containing protein [Alphaproteobacteria bacterium]TAF75912.1 MAG: DUF465 domain-containing protein [Alphaproteobacteria bacterium]